MGHNGQRYGLLQRAYGLGTWAMGDKACVGTGTWVAMWRKWCDVMEWICAREDEMGRCACGWDGLRWSCDVNCGFACVRDSGDAACGGSLPSDNFSIVIIVFSAYALCILFHAKSCSWWSCFSLHPSRLCTSHPHLAHRLNVEHGRVR